MVVRAWLVGWLLCGIGRNGGMEKLELRFRLCCDRLGLCVLVFAL